VIDTVPRPQHSQCGSSGDTRVPCTAARWRLAACRRRHQHRGRGGATGALASHTSGATRREGRGAPHGAAMCETPSRLDGDATAGTRPGAEARHAAHSCCIGEAYRGDDAGRVRGRHGGRHPHLHGARGAAAVAHHSTSRRGDQLGGGSLAVGQVAGLVEGGGRAKCRRQADANSVADGTCRADPVCESTHPGHCRNFSFPHTHRSK